METQNFDTWLCRCSSLGDIMTDAKGKSFKQKYLDAEESYQKSLARYDALVNKDTKQAQYLLETIEKYDTRRAFYQSRQDIPHLGDTCIKHLVTLYTFIKQGRIKEVKVKYFEKGTQCEEEAITLYSLFVGRMFRKNTIRLSNDYIIGEKDVRDGEYIVDTKVSWDIHSFNMLKIKPLNPIYNWQVDGYMWLDNLPKARVVHVLLNTPEKLIENEEKYLLRDFVGSEQDYKDACADLRRNHIFDDLPMEQRIKVYEVKRDDERIDRIKERVVECRKFLNLLNEGKYEQQCIDDSGESGEQEMAA